MVTGLGETSSCASVRGARVGDTKLPYGGVCTRGMLEENCHTDVLAIGGYETRGEAAVSEGADGPLAGDCAARE